MLVARQPIFNAVGDVCAYELRYRSDELNGSDAATMQLLDTAFMQYGVEELTDGQPVFLEFTEHTLVQDLALLLPPDSVVVALGPSVRPTDEVIEACDRLARRDYRLALDRLTVADARLPFLRLAHAVSVDFLALPEAEILKLAPLLANTDELLAKSIDTQMLRRFAEKLGFQLFQGDFLASPDPVDVQEIPVGKFERLRLLQQINRPEMNLNEVEELLKRDPGLSYRLLMLINSAAVGLRQRVTEIRQAMVMLGQVGLMRWASVVALKDIGAGRPGALLTDSLFRARYCELLAQETEFAKRASECFLMGLFSRMDAITGRPLTDLIEALPLTDAITEALLNGRGDFRAVYDLAIAHDSADWQYVSRLAGQLRIPESKLPGLYQDALRWSAGVSRGS